MSRAFVKEDVAPPVPEAQGAFRALWSVNPSSQERELVQSSDDLLELVRWAASRHRGFYQVRDGDNIVLAEIG